MDSDSINLGSTFQEIFKPLLVMMADGLGTLLDAGETEDLRLRLRRAGVATNADDYRLRQLTFAFAGLTLGFLLGWQYSDGNLWFSLGIMAFMGFAGAVIQRTVLDRTLRNRIELIQGELYTVVHLLAMYVRTGHGPVESVRRVAERSSGIVSDQMTQALSWIERGRAADAAFAELAQLTPEPAEARLYRLLSSATVSGTDITDSLIALARDLRNQRRDEVERSAVKRRSTMIIPLLIFSAPVLLALIGGPAVVLILREL
jgi:pilus assembly protein TadC